MPALATYRAPMPIHVYPVGYLTVPSHLHIQSLHVAYSLHCLKHFSAKCLASYTDLYLITWQSIAIAYTDACMHDFPTHAYILLSCS